MRPVRCPAVLRILAALSISVAAGITTPSPPRPACWPRRRRGRGAAGEGLLGLQRAFQVAGARSVVAALWTIDGEAGRQLMIDFYDNLWGKKMSRVEALRAAQLAMLREGMKRGLDLSGWPAEKKRRVPPFYWAGFVLSGDWQ